MKPSAKKKTEKEEMKETSRELFRFSGSLLILILIGVILVFVTTNGYRFGRALFAETSAGSSSVVKTITVEIGESAWDTSEELLADGLIADRYVFTAKSKLFALSVKPGTYEINAGMTDRQILETMSPKK